MAKIEVVVFFIITLCLFYLLMYFVLFQKSADSAQSHGGGGGDGSGGGDDGDAIVESSSLNRSSDDKHRQTTKMIIDEDLSNDVTTNQDAVADHVGGGDPVKSIGKKVKPSKTSAKNDDNQQSINEDVDFDKFVVEMIDADEKPTVMSGYDHQKSLYLAATTNPNLTINTKALLSGFIKMYARRTEYDSVLFDYPKLVRKIDTSSKTAKLCVSPTKYNDWHKDSRILRAVADKLLLALAVNLDEHNKHGKPCHPAIMTFIDKYVEHFAATFNKKTRPWGSEDISFVDSTYLLAIFMISPFASPEYKKKIANMILQIIPKPNMAFNTKLPFVNIIHASTPWILAKHVLNAQFHKTAVLRIKRAAMRQYCDLPSNGFHLDKSFSFNKLYDPMLANKLAIKYKYELLALLVDELNGTKDLTFMSAIEQMNAFILHPSIQIGVYGVNTFDTTNLKLNSTKVLFNTKNNYGIEVMPLSRLLRVFTKNHCFAVRGFANGMKYSPDTILQGSEQVIPIAQFYGSQIRAITSINDKNTVLIPNFGCTLWNSDSVSKNMIVRDIMSFVVNYENTTAAFYQTYTADDSTFGSFQIKEFTTIDYTESSTLLDFTINITNKSLKTQMVYIGYNSVMMKIDPGTTKTIKTTLRIENDSVIVVKPTRQTHNESLEFPLYINSKTKAVKSSLGIMVFKSPNDPKIYCPSTELVIKYPKFEYNEFSNQWVLEK